MKTILDIHVETENGMVHHATFADFPKRGAMISTSRDGALTTAMGEIEYILLDQPAHMIVRLYDTFTMSYTDFKGRAKS